MPKIMLLAEARAHQTEAGAIELRLIPVEGKPVAMAIMPSYARGLRDLFDRLQGMPEPTAVETFPKGAAPVLKALAKGEPRRSGGFRVSVAPDQGAILLNVSHPDGTWTEIPLDQDYAQRLIGHLANAIAAPQPPAGSA